ncbi:SGNH/GDSL hydrolase family protein [Streptomyces sp. JNUCC 64]
MRRTTTTPVARRLAVAALTALALGGSLAPAAPAAPTPPSPAPAARGAEAAVVEAAGEAAGEETPAAPVPTVVFGDSATANYGLAPWSQSDPGGFFCFRAEENYPAVAARRLADRGVTLDVRSDVSCGGALVHHVWDEQETLSGTGLKVPPQQDAFKDDTALAVGGLGGNTLDFVRVLKQCSDVLRGDGHALLPGTPVDAAEPAADCGGFFGSGAGKRWLDGRFERVAEELEELLDHIAYFSPGAERVLVGYPRLIPADTTRCLTPAPGQTEPPFADVPRDALPLLDRTQKRLNDVMRKAAADAEGGARFVDLYARTGAATACDGAERGIGGLLEDSRIRIGDRSLPWYAHPNEKGRDLQARHVADAVEKALDR